RSAEGEAGRVAAKAPFGYDPVKAIQKERRKPDKEDVDALLYPEEDGGSGGVFHGEENLDPLMYPEEEKDRPSEKGSCIKEDASEEEDSLASHEEDASDKDEGDGRHAVETRPESQPSRSLRSLFIDDEAESGDDDDQEEGRRGGSFGGKAKDSEW